MKFIKVTNSTSQVLVVFEIEFSNEFRSTIESRRKMTIINCQGLLKVDWFAHISKSWCGSSDTMNGSMESVPWDSRKQIAISFHDHTSSLITGESITQKLIARPVGKVFQTRKTVNLSKDDLAIHIFSLKHIVALWLSRSLKVWKSGNMINVFFVFPFCYSKPTSVKSLASGVKGRFADQNRMHTGVQSLHDVILKD